eukprot:3795709-Amphidinium_carterae.1
MATDRMIILNVFVSPLADNNCMQNLTFDFNESLPPAAIVQISELMTYNDISQTKQYYRQHNCHDRSSSLGVSTF